MKYLKEIIYFINKKIKFIIIILVFATISKFFTNIYNLYYRNYEERMNIFYGYCERESYGYIKKIKSNFLKTNQAYILNFEDYQGIYGLFTDLKDDTSKKNLILLNFNINKKKLLDDNNINLNDYELFDVEKNCLFYKKK